METRVIVVGLIKKGEQVLLGQKAPGKGPYPDSWHIPGGGIDEGENTEQALHREVKEETGLTVKDIKKIAWDTDVEPNKHGVPTYYIFLQYSCEYESGELLPGDDMHHFEWVDSNKLSEHNLNKPTKILFKKRGYL